MRLHLSIAAALVSTAIVPAVAQVATVAPAGVEQAPGIYRMRVGD